jgi:SAM-dependent methyltransferase
MNNDTEREALRRLATEHAARGDPLGWFDALYRQANGEARHIPWAEQRPNPHLASWIGKAGLTPGRALVVGCGLGDDAEYLASLGWSVEAFDISAEAIGWAKKRFPESKVQFQAVDLFRAPTAWHRRFNLIVEIYTLQAIPAELRHKAIPVIADWVSPGGRLFTFMRGRSETDEATGPPWPLTEKEIRRFEKEGLNCASFEDYEDTYQPGVRRFRVVFARPLTSYYPSSKQ